MKKKLMSFREKILRFFKYDFETILTFGIKLEQPYLRLCVGYISYIIFGTLLLTLPFMRRGPVGFLDNLFTAASAVSTTGLATVDLAMNYNLAGQIVVLFLIQLGGLSYMTVSSFVMLKLTKHFTMIKKRVLQAEFSVPGGFDINNLVLNIVGFTIIFETVGAVLLYVFFKASGADSPLWSAIFHSVSAFCTAGFSIYPDNLIQFDTNIGVNLVIMVLCYAGAMGYIVMYDLWKRIRIRKHKISFTTKVIVLVTLILTVFGTAEMFLFEPGIRQFSFFNRFLVSVFQTMSALTTVGYNTVNVADFLPVSLMTVTLIMYFGASPSGTGGGLKSTTISAVFAYVKSKLSLQRDTYLFKHRIPTYRVDNALTTVLLYSFVLIFGSYLLSATERDISYIQLIFEAGSALGTVGLSTGITAELSAWSKIILVFLMYIGRVGVLTIGYSMLLRMRSRTKLLGDVETDLAI